MDNLLTQCNADVYKAILDIKEKSPEIGEPMFTRLSLTSKKKAPKLVRNSSQSSKITSIILT